MIATINKIPVYNALVSDEDTGMVRISLVDEPAVMSNFQAFKEHKARQLYAVTNEEKHLVRGCVMRADFPIYRSDEQNGEYYIIYKADTIRKMAEKYLVDNKQNAVDTMHNGQEVEGVQMVQYFIKGEGVSVDGFEDCADGSLFAEFHITNEQIWEDVKNGTYKGFSLEGYFDLVPNRDKEGVQQLVDDLHGEFAEEKPIKTKNMSKMARLRAALSKILVELGNVTTDKGVLAWDGEEDLKVGDSVYIENENGEQAAAEDGDYKTADNKVIVVIGGVVSEIKDAEAEVAPAEPQEQEAQEQTFAEVATDKAVLYWEGEGELEAGVAVFVEQEGEKVAAADGEYVTEDGKTIVVAEGKVAEIKDAEAEVAPEEGETEEMKKRKACKAKREAFELTYDERFKKIATAIEATGILDFYIVDAADDFAVAEVYESNEDGVFEHKYLRYPLTWNEEEVTLGEAVEVKPMFVPLDYKSPFETEAEELRSENETLKAELATLRKEPAAKSAHEQALASMRLLRDESRGVDRIAALMSRK